MSCTCALSSSNSFSADIPLSLLVEPLCGQPATAVAARAKCEVDEGCDEEDDGGVWIGLENGREQVWQEPAKALDSEAGGVQSGVGVGYGAVLSDTTWAG
jgi:hypothetical protein